MLLLKTAAVIGEVFGMQQLKSSYLIEESTKLSLQSLLNVLESCDFIEYLYSNEEAETFYRFNYPFLRDALYSLMLYEDQKKVIHGKVIDYMKENILNDWTVEVSIALECINLLISGAKTKKLTC